MRVLVIEANESARRAMVERLRLEGLDVAEAASGPVGLAVQRARPADVVVTDVVLPADGADDTIAELRRRYPAVKLIAISGGESLQHTEHILRQARDSGADAVLPKPFTVRELVALVRGLES